MALRRSVPMRRCSLRTTSIARAIIKAILDGDERPAACATSLIAVESCGPMNLPPTQFWTVAAEMSNFCDLRYRVRLAALPLLETAASTYSCHFSAIRSVC